MKAIIIRLTREEYEDLRETVRCILHLVVQWSILAVGYILLITS